MFRSKILCQAYIVPLLYDYDGRCKMDDGIIWRYNLPMNQWLMMNEPTQLTNSNN